ncbi:enoyl-CoA hydratase/isomerase family protein [Nocardia sp. IFM 10818]
MYEYDTLRVRSADGVVWVTLDNPPLNLASLELGADLTRFVDEVATDDEARVIVFQSALPDYFIAHVDVAELDWPETPPYWAVLKKLSTLPKVSIAKIAGRVRGGGSEFALACDMRFASAERAVFGQPEVAVGMVFGGGATQRLPRLMGRGRALEVILGAGDYPAELAERYGWINRALPDAELDDFVDALAQRIAAFPPHAIAAAKGLVDRITLPSSAELAAEYAATKIAMAEPEFARRIGRLFELGLQTPGPVEYDQARYLAEL